MYFWDNLTVSCLFHFNIISSFWKWQMDFWGAAMGISICLISLNVVEKWVCIYNQYLYTPYIHQIRKAWEPRHTYGEILMLLVPFHGSVHNDRIPKLKGICPIFLSAIYQLFIKYFNIKYSILSSKRIK